MTLGATHVLANSRRPVSVAATVVATLIALTFLGASDARAAAPVSVRTTTTSMSRPHEEQPAQPATITAISAGWLPAQHHNSLSARSLVTAAAATPTAPFTECPAVGADTSCGLLIDVTNHGLTVLGDPNQGPYDGGDDTLVGVLNQSSSELGHISLTSDTPIFGFDGDGICTYGLEGCPFGPTGYEGPGTSYIEISPDSTSGVVSFTNGVPPGGSAYFSLEEPLTTTSVVSSGPSRTEQGGAPNGSEHPTTCSSSMPVNCATGVFWHEFTDANLPGHGIPLKLTRTYSSSNASTDGPLGFGWTDSYNMSVSIDEETGDATIHEEGGSSVTFPSDGEGQFVTPARVLASLVQNEDGTYTFTRFSNHIRYVFAEDGSLLREIDRNGYTTRFTYAGGLLEKVVAPSGRQLTFTYSGSRIHTATDSMGRTTTYTYDPSGNLVETTDPLGRSWTLTYSPTHMLLTMTDPRGGTTANTYDGSGRVTAQTDPMGRETTWVYEGSATSTEGGTTTSTDARGSVTIYRFRDLELTSVTRGAGTPQEATTTYHYAPTTLGITHIVNPDGIETRFSYDERGNIVESIEPENHVTHYSYGPEDELTESVDPMGTPTYYRYDSHGNVLEKAPYLSETGEYVRTTYGYGGAPGEITESTNPDGHITTYAYDSAGDRTRVTGPAGDTTTFAYNADGELISEVSPVGNEPGGDPAAHTTTYERNADGEITKETDPLGHSMSYTFDGDANTLSIIDPMGNATEMIYNADSELVRTKRPGGSQLETEWDAAGNQITQIDGSGHRTVYAYDALNRMVSATDPDGHTTTYAYDPAGQLTVSVNAEGQETFYGYNSVGELTSTSYSSGETTPVYEYYDANGNRTQLTDGSGTSSFTYDSLNRMTSAANGDGATTHYEYDLAGQLIKLTYSNARSVTRAYDTAGRLTAVTDWLGHTTHFSYKSNADLTTEGYPNGVTTQLGYDAANHLISISDANGAASLASFQYTRDAAGQVEGETVSNGQIQNLSYSHDSLDQITGEGDAPYAYNAAGDPTTFGAETTQHFDPASEVLSSNGPRVQVVEEPLEETPGSHEETPPGGGHETPAPVVPGGGGTRPNPPSPPAPDTIVTTKGTGGQRISSKLLRTHNAGDLLVAFISATGHSTRQRVRTVTSPGLHWSLVGHEDGSNGIAEIWQANATSRYSGHVTVQLGGGSRFDALTVAAFGGNEPYVVASAAGKGQRSSPKDGLTAPAGSVLWAVGHSTSQKHPQTAGNSQQLVVQAFSRGSSTDGWVQHATPASPGAPVVDNAKAGHWGLMAIAVGQHASASASTSSLGPTTASRKVDTARQASAVGNTPGTGGATHSSTETPVTRDFSYNARGDRIEERTTGAPAVTLSYDQADRLTGVGSAISYAYNGDGLRVSKTVNGVMTNFVWNQAASNPELLEGGSTYYIYGPGGAPIEQIEGETPTYLHQDQQGSTRLLTDASGKVVGRYRYNAWGQVIGYGGTATTSLLFDGQYTDAETGFQYLRTRYYDPSTGQFLTQDPEFITTLERYGFGGNDPLDQVDPMGLASTKLVYRVIVSCPAGNGPCTTYPPDPCTQGFVVTPYTEFEYNLHPAITPVHHPVAQPPTNDTDSLINQYVNDAAQCQQEQQQFATGVFRDTGVAPEDDSPEALGLWQQSGTFSRTLNGSACRYQ